jgi:hypothetical protein
MALDTFCFKQNLNIYNLLEQFEIRSVCAYLTPNLICTVTDTVRNKQIQ